jgi:hypothetical protein
MVNCGSWLISILVQKDSSKAPRSNDGKSVILCKVVHNKCTWVLDRKNPLASTIISGNEAIAKAARMVDRSTEIGFTGTADVYLPAYEFPDRCAAKYFWIDPEGYMRRLILFLALLGAAGIARAEDTYIYDLLKDPVYARSWKTLTSAKRTPAWVRDDNRYIAGAVKIIAIDTVKYQVSVISKQHATNDGQASILFTMDGTQAWAEVQEEKRPALYLGEPSPAQKAALDNAIAE